MEKWAPKGDLDGKVAVLEGVGREQGRPFGFFFKAGMDVGDGDGKVGGDWWWPVGPWDGMGWVGGVQEVLCYGRMIIRWLIFRENLMVRF